MQQIIQLQFSKNEPKVSWKLAKNTSYGLKSLDVDAAMVDTEKKILKSNFSIDFWWDDEDEEGAVGWRWGGGGDYDWWGT